MSVKRIAILQPNYIPWKGYFDLIAAVDEFILYDDTQYTKRDWRNRNQIKTPQGKTWLTIPVDVKGKYEQQIKDVSIADQSWADKHLNSLKHSYGKAPYFKEYEEELVSAYRQAGALQSLCEVNKLFTDFICGWLGIGTKITWSSDYGVAGEREDKLLALCKACGAGEYLSGPAAKDYIPDNYFEAEGVKLFYADYEHYPVYEQLHGDFDHYVSVFDLLFMTGNKARDYMISGQSQFIDAA